MKANPKPEAVRLGGGAGCKRLLLLLGALLLAPAGLRAQYAINWQTIACGGGTCTGGVYSLSVTIGQPLAGGPITGGNYSLMTGFWSIYAVQTAGAPLLSVTRSNATVVVSWPAPAVGWQLEYTTTLANGTNSWTLIPPPYATNATQLHFTEPVPTGKKFYRLYKP
jgi:hypothetical protein